MSKLNLPNKDSATQRGLKTAAQAMIGFVVGLFVAVWAVPGVPEAAISYVKDNLVQVLLIVGVPSGLTSFIWNTITRKDVEKY